MRSRMDVAVVVIRAVSPAMGFTSSQPMAAGRSWSVTFLALGARADGVVEVQTAVP